MFAIKFCVKLKKMVREMKEMLDAVYSESAMSQGSVYRWYNKFKSCRKSAEFIGEPDTPTTVLTKQSVHMVQQ